MMQFIQISLKWKVLNRYLKQNNVIQGFLLTNWKLNIVVISWDVIKWLGNQKERSINIKCHFLKNSMNS